MKKGFLIFFILLSSLVSAQVPDLAALSFVKQGKIVLRWAPSKPELWKTANLNGYKIERVAFSQYNSTSIDSLRFKNAVTTLVFPWKQNDERWKSLISKNKSTGFLFNSMYVQDSKTPVDKKKMMYGILMKSCDLNKEFALAAGLILTDSLFDPNETYVYRISIANPPKNTKAGQVTITVKAKELSTLPKIETLKAKFGDRIAVLNFVTKDVKDYSGYWIERSEDSTNYSIANKSPFIRTTTKYDEHKNESYYKDSLPTNDKRYYYRIKGISCFGETGQPSNIVSGKGKPDFTVYPVIDSTNILKNSFVQLKFGMPQGFDQKLLRSFAVFRSEKRNGSYTCISGTLNSASTSFTDEKPTETNYYKVCAVNIYVDSSFSMTTYAKLIDETPPAIPAEPTSVIDSIGIVKLSWKANTDKDLLGYRLYRGNSLGEQPVELTKKLLSKPEFRDSISLKSLTREVFYFVRAVDKNYNNSTYSEACKLMRPDKIPPVAIVFREIVPTDSSIILNWHPSSSLDVKKYRIHRKENNNNWALYKAWETKKVSSFVDSNLVGEYTYQYKIEVLDESGNNSLTESHSILFKPAFYPKIKNFKASANLEKRNIELQWPAAKNIYSYTLYKGKGTEPLVAVKTLDSETNSFIDTQLYPNNKYRYAIKATLTSGSETKLSDIIEVEF